MRNLKIGVSALALPVLTAVTIAIANPPGQNGQQDPTPQIPKTWDDQAMATLEVPLADAPASPVPVSGDYYYRIPVRPIYKTYPVYHPSKEPSDYFERLKTLEPEVVRLDSSNVRTEDDWIRAGEIVFDTPTDYDISGSPAQFRDPSYYTALGIPVAKRRHRAVCEIRDPRKGQGRSGRAGLRDVSHARDAGQQRGQRRARQFPVRPHRPAGAAGRVAPGHSGGS